MKCRICSGQTRRAFNLRSRRVDQTVPVFRCSACNAYFSNGGSTNYDDADLTEYYTRYAEAIRVRYHRLMTEIERHCGVGSLIDIGSGMGFSLQVAKARGWSASGIEPNQSLAFSAKERGLDVAHGYLSDDAAGQYDVVLIDNVLEHVPDPAAMMRQAKRLMTPDALLVLAVPPLDWLRRWLGAIPAVRNKVSHPQLNVFNEVDEHVNLLGRKSVRRLASTAELQVLPVRYHHSRAFNNFGFRLLGLDDGYYFLRK